MDSSIAVPPFAPRFPRRLMMNRSPEATRELLSVPTRMSKPVESCRTTRFSGNSACNRRGRSSPRVR